MSVKIMIPTALRPYTQQQETVDVPGKNMGELLDNLTRQFPDLKKHLFSEDGQIRSFVNLYLNDEDVRYLQQNETEVKEGDVISIVPSVAGG